LCGGKLPADTRLESIDLGDPAAGFMREGQPPYNAPLDFKSHVAAECGRTNPTGTSSAGCWNLLPEN
jgi:hypothetical protein